MDDAVRAREAAREALADIEPDRLRDVLDDRLSGASMAPGVLTLRSARALDSGANVEPVAERAAGVQLIYEGLRLTRSLAHDPPWERLAADGAGGGEVTDTGGAGREGTAEPDGDDAEARGAVDRDGERPTADGRSADILADLDILAADVLVSRGFYLLARTDAADRAVETVRAFGRDQTRRREPGADVTALDRNLEADVFGLAVVAGGTAVGRDPPVALLEYAADLGHGQAEGDLAPVADSLADATVERIATFSTGADDRVPSSASDS